MVNLGLLLLLAGIVVPVGIAGARRGATRVGLLLRPLLPCRPQVVEELLALRLAIARRGMLLPVAYHEEAKHHAAQVGQMGHAVARRRERREEFNAGVDHHKPLRLDRNRQREDEDALLGENHAESQQNGIDGTRGTHRGPGIQQAGTVVGHCRHHCPRKLRNLLAGHQVELPKLGQLLKKTGTDTARNVIKKELFRTPYTLHHAAKHPQGKHVEEQVVPTAMHEHVGEQLVQAEVGGHEEMQSQHVVQHVAAHGVGAHQRADKKCQHIDDEQVSCNGRYVSHHNFCLCSIMSAKVRKNPVILHKKRALNTKFQKKIIFFRFLFVFLK